MDNRAKHSQLIKSLGQDAGFLYVGISEAKPLDDEARKLEQWLAAGRHGKMAYMERYFDMRTNPQKLVEGAKSVVTLLFNYHNPNSPQPSGAPKVSQYAYGEDYHQVIKDKLRGMVACIKAEIGEVNGRVFVDSAPVMEKAWAVHSGAGWMGKHTNVIHPKHGSWFFLAELILDLPLLPDGPIKDYCGTCTRCIDACPTGAIFAPYQLDASRCISYLTIELRDAELPETFRGRMEGWAFGCDICQEVCPWNRFAEKHNEPRLEPNSNWGKMEKEAWLEMTEDVFRQVFRKSAVKRTKFSGWKRNVSFIN
jgi:epoxyqueuosine reductase